MRVCVYIYDILVESASAVDRGGLPQREDDGFEFNGKISNDRQVGR